MRRNPGSSTVTALSLFIPAPPRLDGSMDFGWLKRMMPRGLYGRAALILLVPIVTLQLVVSSAILQRYFEEVAGQMSHALALDLALVLDQIDTGGPADAI